MEEVKIIIRFHDKEMTAREYISFSKDILMQLKYFSDDFKTLYAWGTEANAGTYLKEDLTDFESVVLNQLRDDEIAYSNPDKSNKDFTLDSKCFIGYRNSYSTNQDYKQDQITVTIEAGKESAKKNDAGILNFKFSKSLQSKLDLQYLLKLLELNVNLVNPYYATVSSFKFNERINKDDTDIEIGWITYIADTKIIDLLPSDIEKKHIINRGTIFWISKEKALSTNEYDVKKGIEIRDILALKGFLDIPAN